MPKKVLQIIFLSVALLLFYTIKTTAQDSAGSIVITEMEGIPNPPAGSTQPPCPDFYAPGQTINIQGTYDPTNAVSGHVAYQVYSPTWVLVYTDEMPFPNLSGTFDVDYLIQPDAPVCGDYHDCSLRH